MSFDSSYGVAVDDKGNVTLTGYFNGTADLGGGNVTSRGFNEIFVTSFSSEGVHRWQKALTGSGDNTGHDIAVDASGNVTLTGTFNHTVDLGGGDVTSKGINDIFVTSFTSEGVHRWQRALGSPSSDEGWGVATDGSGNVTLTGRFSDTIDLGGGDVVSKGITDV
ncbi:MAG: hypothetical protein JRH20_32780, partial [Deltaproteobacteria bacterium]|nr:hypothetical protein [Deltaproteobacteria bacterium]